MRLRVGVRTDIGRSRGRNEDSYLVKDPLFAVADGMGGHRGGDVASSLALEILREAANGAGSDFQPVVEQIRAANRGVLERGEADRDLRGMGTTLTAVVARGDKAHVAHVGDSRAYLWREGRLQQLTEDHTLVQRMVREGRLTEEEAAGHPQRSIVTRALGVEEDVPIDQLTLDLKPGDRLVLCTDGLTTMVPREVIQEIIGSEPDPQAACDRLVEEANRAGGDDNITVVVVEVLDGEPAAVADESPPASAVALDGPPAGMAVSATKTEDRPTGPAGEERLPDTAPRPGSGSGRGTTGRGSRWRRRAIWVGVLVAVVVSAMLVTRFYVGRQWYVGASDGRVAIYNGIPARVLGLKLSHVQETTDLSAADAERLAYWRNLESGITADSFADAQAIVARIRLDLAGAPPAPTPSPSPSPTST